MQFNEHTKKGALGGRDVNGTKRSTAAMKCMLHLSLADPCLVLATENVETPGAVSSPQNRGGKSLGRI